ncbi:MAG: indole-3-glycerol phosphate synthase TrpC [Herpetosiphonaceae bacterium]|nr:indole-3-glycerol phosphate synthase TrpC [Herpetosiphonaceae bacterium]
MADNGFLPTILEHKRTEVKRQQQKIPTADLVAQLQAAAPVRPFSTALRQLGRLGLIAEVKKQSPAKGLLVPNFDALRLAHIYADNGADAISVLTDTRFWGGSLQYLKAIRTALPDGPPLLRKDVIIDSYQLYEARVYGADAVLLIAAALDELALAELHHLTYQLGMEALVEVHTMEEAERVLPLRPRLLGINNRNLHTFVVDVDITRQIIMSLPTADRPIVISESGIGGEANGDRERLRGWGADAILVGEAIVTAPDPAAKVRALAGRQG